ncbi:hypothetical protein NDU88_001086 [Pleurodeles waltl]|uniref:Uncharacterized protein n=1 Tax=Pleurodeles waltl TaxID=8319 RepID=A0AAV7MIR2_PLEWA|nr:hypothetical protein NDU88_001086 [Pleurodeles waltl]
MQNSNGSMNVDGCGMLVQRKAWQAGVLFMACLYVQALRERPEQRRFSTSTTGQLHHRWDFETGPEGRLPREHLRPHRGVLPSASVAGRCSGEPQGRPKRSCCVQEKMNTRKRQIEDANTLHQSPANAHGHGCRLFTWALLPVPLLPTGWPVIAIPPGSAAMEHDGHSMMQCTRTRASVPGTSSEVETPRASSQTSKNKKISKCRYHKMSSGKGVRDAFGYQAAFRDSKSRHPAAHNHFHKTQSMTVRDGRESNRRASLQAPGAGGGCCAGRS